MLGCVVSNELRRIWKEVVVAWYGELSKTLNWPCDIIYTEKCYLYLIHENDFARVRLETNANPPDHTRLLLDLLPRNSTLSHPISICISNSFACLLLGLPTGLFPRRVVTGAACQTAFHQPRASLLVWLHWHRDWKHFTEWSSKETWSRRCLLYKYRAAPRCWRNSNAISDHTYGHSCAIFVKLNLS